MRRATIAALAATGLFAAGCGAGHEKGTATPTTPTTSRATPTLGRVWGQNQQGYGRVGPRVINNGGDPTGVVTKIRWTGWGSPQATGIGVAEYVWPGTIVADNGAVDGAHVIAFHLGTCRGRPAYTALTWYFPAYDERFDPKHYWNICTGQYIGSSPRLLSCPDVELGDGSGLATEVSASGTTCDTARAAIATIPTGPYHEKGGRFRHGPDRCGSAGGNVESPASFWCSDGVHHDYGFTLGS